MMRDHHRRSPESSRRKRREHRHSGELPLTTTAMPATQTNPQHIPVRSRAGSSSTSDSSSSTSDSLLNISAPKPHRSGFFSFFKSPEPIRRRRSRKRKTRFLRLGNSSSSSLEEGLLYGKGYISRSRVFDTRERSLRDVGSPSRPSGPKRAQTDEEILEIGRKLAKMAREENQSDIARAGRRPTSQLVATAAAINKLRREGTGDSLNRGIGSSRPHGHHEDSEWESASDDEGSSSDDGHSALAYGSGVSLPIRRRQSGGKPAEAPTRPNLGQWRRKSSVVDPKMFGPYNSLRDFVNTPCGFEDDDQAARPSDPHRVEPIPPIESASIEGKRPLQTVYPVPTSDPTRFDAGRGSIVSGAQSGSRPEPVPIQAPKPRAPVNTRVFEDERLIDSQSRDSRRKSEGKSFEAAAVAAGAGVAIGAAMMANRKDKERDRDDRRNKDERRDREDKYEPDDRRNLDGGRRSKRDSVKIIDDRDDKRSSRDEKHDDRPMERRTKAEWEEYDREKKRRRDREYEEYVAEKERSKHKRSNDEPSRDKRDSRKDAHKEDPRDSQKPTVDPFQYQVEDDAFQTPTFSPTPKRPLTPMVFTIDREPDFSRIDTLAFDESSERMSRRDSFEHEMKGAKKVYREAADATAPVPASAVAAAISAVNMEELEQKRGRDPEPRRNGKDSVQAEADRYYREMVIARKIAEDQIRSRSASPDPSVVEKWKEDEEDPVIRIVTPPEMDRKHDKSIFDGPNADVRIDNKIYPDELVKFRAPRSQAFGGSIAPIVTVFKSRDPSCERERPLLNLVYPTPAPTPTPEKREEKAASKKQESAKDKPKESVEAKDVVIGPKGDIVKSPTTTKPSTNDQASSDKPREIPQERDTEPPTRRPSQTKKSKSGKKSGWGMIAAAVAGAGTAAAVKDSVASDAKKGDGEVKQERQKTRESERVGSPIEREIQSKTESTRGVKDDLNDEPPPPPGPKPPSPRASQMPGAFADDIDFAATVAAGLQDSGFDPNIVIDDPTYRRRDSPPGSNGPAPYQQPFAETVTDLGIVAPLARADAGNDDDLEFSSKLSKKDKKKLGKAKRQGTDPREIEAAPEVPQVDIKPTEEEDDFRDVKLSKKEQKKRDKVAKAQLAQEEMSSSKELPREQPRDLVEDEWAEPSSKKKKSKKSKTYTSELDDVEETTTQQARDLPRDQSVDIGDDKWAEASSKKKSKKSRKTSSAWDDEPEPQDKGLRRSETADTNDDDWADAGNKKKSKKSKKSDFSWDDDVAAAEAERRIVASPPPMEAEPDKSVNAGDDEWAETTSKKKKSKKSKRSSSAWDDSGTTTPANEDRRISVPVDAFDDLSRERPAEPADDWESSKKSKKKSKRDSTSYDSPSRSVPPSEVSVESSSHKSKKDRRKSAPVEDDDIPGGFDDPDKGEPPDKTRDKYKPKDRDVSSVVSVPTKYDDRYESRSNGSRYEDADDTKSVASAPTGSDKTKSNKQDKRSSGGFFGIFKNGTDDREKGSSKSEKSEDGNKKSSFLDNAGTLGAGVGLAGAVAAVATHVSRSNAGQVSSDEEPSDFPHSSAQAEQSPPRGLNVVDPDIVQRVIKPAIDPQYGDLLPLPPSEPGSPAPEVQELPALPESRPGTPPEHERQLLREKFHTRRRSAFETPTKSPSHTAVPIQFRLGQRSGPSSPAFLKSSPLQSPITPGQDTGGMARRLARPTSWESSKEIKPLQLLKHARSSSHVEMHFQEPSPTEPPQEIPSPEIRSDESRAETSTRSRGRSVDEPLRIDTVIANIGHDSDHLGSQEVTPKAEIAPQLGDHLDTHPSSDAEASDIFEDAASYFHPSASQSPVMTRPFEDHTDVPPLPETTRNLFMDEPRSRAESDKEFAFVEDISISEDRPKNDFTSRDEPDSVESMSKDRSSYLLHTTPPSVRKSATEDVTPRSPGFSPTLKGLPSEKVIPEGTDLAVQAALGVAAGGLIAAAALHESENQKPEDVVEQGVQPVFDSQKETSPVLSPSHSQAEDITTQESYVAKDEAAEVPEFSFVESKKGKKGKKKQRKSQFEDDPFDEVVPATTRPEMSEASQQDPTVPASGEAQTEMPSIERSTSISKKGKKKKGKKFTAWESEEPPQDDLEDVSSQALAKELEAVTSNLDLQEKPDFKVSEEIQTPKAPEIVEKSWHEPSQDLTYDKPLAETEVLESTTAERGVDKDVSPADETQAVEARVEIGSPRQDEPASSMQSDYEPASTDPSDAPEFSLSNKAKKKNKKKKGSQMVNDDFSTQDVTIVDELGHSPDQEIPTDRVEAEQFDQGPLDSEERRSQSESLPDLAGQDVILFEPAKEDATTDTSDFASVSSKKSKKKKKGSKFQPWEPEPELDADTRSTQQLSSELEHPSLQNLERSTKPASSLEDISETRELDASATPTMTPHEDPRQDAALPELSSLSDSIETSGFPEGRLGDSEVKSGDPDIAQDTTRTPDQPYIERGALELSGSTHDMGTHEPVSQDKSAQDTLPSAVDTAVLVPDSQTSAQDLTTTDSQPPRDISPGEDLLAQSKSVEHDVQSVHDELPSLPSVDEPLPTSHIDETTQKVTDETSPDMDWEQESGTSNKRKGKKAKNKGQSIQELSQTQDTSKSSPAVELDAPKSPVQLAEPDVVDVNAVDQPPVPSFALGDAQPEEPAQEDLWSEPSTSKKSKKGKKKKGLASSFLTEDEPPTDLVEPGEAETMDTQSFTDASRPSNTMPGDDQEPPFEPIVTGKKSKKDKKRKSSLAASQIVEPTEDIVEESEQAVSFPKSTIVGTDDVPAFEETTAPLENEAQPDDIWDAPGKKKKKKKKQGAAQISLDEEPSSTSQDVPELAPENLATEVAAQGSASQPDEADDLFSFPTKKGRKKDKKKRQGVAFDEPLEDVPQRQIGDVQQEPSASMSPDETRTTPSSPPSKPLHEVESSAVVEEEPSDMPSEKSVDMGPAEISSSPKMSEDDGMPSQPASSPTEISDDKQRINVADVTREVDQRSPLAESQEHLQTSEPPPSSLQTGDDALSGDFVASEVPINLRKSKKDKKKKKSKVFDDFEPKDEDLPASGAAESQISSKESALPDDAATNKSIISDEALTTWTTEPEQVTAQDDDIVDEEFPGTFTLKKSKKDKKKKRKSVTFADDVPESSPAESTREDEDVHQVLSPTLIPADSLDGDVSTEAPRSVSPLETVPSLSEGYNTPVSALPTAESEEKTITATEEAAIHSQMPVVELPPSEPQTLGHSVDDGAKEIVAGTMDTQIGSKSLDDLQSESIPSDIPSGHDNAVDLADTATSLPSLDEEFPEFKPKKTKKDNKKKKRASVTWEEPESMPEASANNEVIEPTMPADSLDHDSPPDGESGKALTSERPSSPVDIPVSPRQTKISEVLVDEALQLSETPVADSPSQPLEANAPSGSRHYDIDKVLDEVHQPPPMLTDEPETMEAHSFPDPEEPQSFAIKKSKKDKKKKRGSKAQLDIDEPDKDLEFLPQPSTDNQDIPTEDTTTLPPAEPIVSDTKLADDDDFEPFPVKKSKKEKQKAKKKLQLALESDDGPTDVFDEPSKDTEILSETPLDKALEAVLEQPKTLENITPPPGSDPVEPSFMSSEYASTERSDIIEAVLQDPLVTKTTESETDLKNDFAMQAEAHTTTDAPPRGQLLSSISESHKSLELPGNYIEELAHTEQLEAVEHEPEVAISRELEPVVSQEPETTISHEPETMVSEELEPETDMFPITRKLSKKQKKQAKKQDLVSADSGEFPVEGHQAFEEAQKTFEESTQTQGQSISEAPEQPVSQDIAASQEAEFPEFTFSGKKSKKDKRRKGTKSNSEPASGTVTPAREKPADFSSTFDETVVSSQGLDLAPLDRSVTAGDNVAASDDWPEFAVKKKKDKKRKGSKVSGSEPASGTQTPAYEEPVISTVTRETSIASVFEEPQSFAVEETVPVDKSKDDDFEQFPTKKSKKNKKNQKSVIPVDSERPISPVLEPVQDLAQEPVQELVEDVIRKPILEPEVDLHSSADILKSVEDDVHDQEGQPPALEKQTTEAVSLTSEKDIWDDDDFFKPKKVSGTSTPSAGAGVRKLELNPAVSDILASRKGRDEAPLASPSPPTVGWGLMTRHDSDVFDREGHVPKLLTNQSFSPTFESSPEDIRRSFDEALQSPRSPSKEIEAPVSQSFAKPLAIDLKPAQDISHVPHEPPFGDTPQPGKKLKTVSIDDKSTPGFFPAIANVPTYFDKVKVQEPLVLAGSTTEDSPSTAVLSESRQLDDGVPSSSRQPLTSDSPKLVQRHVSFKEEADIQDLPEPVMHDSDVSAREIAASLLEEMGPSRHDVVDPTADHGQENMKKPVISADKHSIESPFEDLATPFTGRESASTQEHDDSPRAMEIDVGDEPPSAREIAASYLAHDSTEMKPTRSEEKNVSKKSDGDNDSDDKELVAAAGALTGGVALLAQKFGGSKKGKGKGKAKKKVLDKRTSRDDDIFDDPALWEGADRKPLEGSRMDVDSDNFWDVTEPSPSTRDDLPATELSPSKSTDRSLDSYDENGRRGGTDLHRQHLEDADDAESPVLGRRDSDRIRRAERFTAASEKSRELTPKGEDKLHRPVLPSPPTSKEPSVEPGVIPDISTTRALNFSPQDIMEMDEPIARSVEPADDIVRARLSPRSHETSDFKRSLTGGLPPVLEEAHEEEPDRKPHHKTDYSRHLAMTPDANRDSGFMADSPHPLRRSHHDDDGHRDSGVHVREAPDVSPRRHDVRRFSPEPRHHSHSHSKDKLETPTHKISRQLEREATRSPFADKSATPILKEPIAHPRTPEPQKVERSSKRASYKELGLAAAAGRASPRAVMGGAASQRSVSDNARDDRDDTLRAEHVARRSASNTSIARRRTPEPLNLRPESPGSLRSFSGTPPLRAKRVSGDLRSLSQRSSQVGAGTSSAAATAVATVAAAAVGLAAAKEISDLSSSRAAQNITPIANEGRVRGPAKDMTDVYEAVGEGRVGSPRSPTRPHSMRRRQSMQVLDLESRVEQLLAENRILSDARIQAENSLSQKSASLLVERDNQIDSLKHTLEHFRQEVARLTEVNEGLTSAIDSSALQHNDRYRQLENRHDEKARALEQIRGDSQTLQDKDDEIADLRAQLEDAKEQIREMQRQILATKPADAEFVTIFDVDHFDNRCRQLCSHVQQWVLRFSKFSDMRACRLTSEINDEKIIDRLDNAVLDGSDVDVFLSDRVKRRDIFMSMTMTMIWEFVFTRYLFGMDREQRQKLKSLEKLLLEVGPPQAVRQWRAVTLTLLANREAFAEQREQDTEAVVQAILQTLSMILPPPSNLEDQIQNQLRRVMKEAVDLSVEMRSQRAEYMMLPPLQPEYDANGDLAETVAFNAALMNERSGDANISNEDLEAAGATVRVVLFPLVVKKGDDGGAGDDEIVVCPAQVLISKSSGKKPARGVTPSSDAGGASLLRGHSPSVMGANQSNVSMADVPGDGQSEAEYLEGGF